MLGLIFGDTQFPKEILKKLKKLKIDYFIIDLSTNKVFKKEKNVNYVFLGQFGKIVEIIKSYKCKKIIFAGKVKKPNFSSLKLDLKGIYYIPKIIKAAKKGDAAILKEIIQILSKEKIKVLKSNHFNPELTLKKGMYTKTKPTKENLNSIKYGVKILNKQNSLDHIQGLVVDKNNKVYKEGRGGTKKLIYSIKKNKNLENLLIKFPKRKQDLRIDLPTIGIDTLKDCKKLFIKGIILKSNANILIDKKSCVNFANKNKIFLKVI